MKRSVRWVLFAFLSAAAVACSREPPPCDPQSADCLDPVEVGHSLDFLVDRLTAIHPQARDGLPQAVQRAAEQVRERARSPSLERRSSSSSAESFRPWAMRIPDWSCRPRR